MKKIYRLFLFIFLLFGSLSVTSCGDINPITTRYTRDTSSGTREAFFELIDYRDAKTDNTLIPGAVEVSSNGTMLQSIKNDEYGIGYVSLTSISSNVKAIALDGVAATEENVLNGTYTLTRNFNYVTRVADDMTETEATLVKAFLLFMNSREGLAIIKSKDGIISNEMIANSKPWNVIIDQEGNEDIKTLCQSTTKTIINFGGSTSVEKMAKELTQAFKNKCKGFDAYHDHTGSSDAYKRTQGSDKNSQNKLHIGFLSRQLKDSEACGEGTNGLVCVDGIAVIVNKANEVSSLTKNELKSIYQSDSMLWEEFM